MAFHSNLTGRYVAALRRERGLSQEGFAERIGVTCHAVSSWESGRRAMHRAVAERFLAVTEVLNCSAFEREDLYGAARADQFLHDLFDASGFDAVYRLFATSMPGRMRDWLTGVFTRNRLICDNGEYALGRADFVAIRDKMTRAVEAALRVNDKMDGLHVLLLFLARSGQVGPGADRIVSLLATAFDRLANPVARRDVAIALAELGDTGVMRRYMDLTEDDERDRDANLRWMARIDQESLPGPEVLRRLVEIVERYVEDPPADPLTGITLRTIGQLLAWRGVAACDSVSVLHRLALVLENLAGRPKVGDPVRRRAGDVGRQVATIAGSLAEALNRLAGPGS
ncbi:MAG: helix-turn-helix domain-containing protein [Peptococcaceae bacterium]|jgi:transcriptional regulator with XRE-family HTH domain|nr:helix-turn-helix domain-containing protein [Peptococcaceae bacterium]